MKTVIMAGGKGTRISELFPDIPKPLIPITSASGESKPVLEWEICNLRNQMFTEIILTVSHMADKIQSYFGDGSKLGVKIQYFVEKKPLGNAGALFELRDKLKLDDDFLLLNADTMFDIDFNRMVRFHREHNALVTLFTHPNGHPYDSGLIMVDEQKSVVSWLTKDEQRPTYYKNRVNAGLHVINPKVLDMANIDSQLVVSKNEDSKSRCVDLDRQILKPLCGTGTMFAYYSPEYVKDMGTSERFYSVSCDFKNGVVESKNLNHKQKAVFLDRDGTINKYVGFLKKIDDFEILPGVAKAINKINSSEYLCIVVTNQPVIARGEVTMVELDKIHNKMETLLGLEGAYIDALYYCPHHPDRGFEGENLKLKIECDCRKPKPGMLIKAASDFNIDLSSSWMVGDRESDIKTGMNAGCHTVLITQSAYETYGADMTVSNLLEFVEKVLQ